MRYLHLVPARHAAAGPGALGRTSGDLEWPPVSGAGQPVRLARVCREALLPYFAVHVSPAAIGAGAGAGTAGAAFAAAAALPGVLGAASAGLTGQAAPAPPFVSSSTGGRAG